MTQLTQLTQLTQCDLGNTSTKSHAGVRARGWCFTLNNYGENEVDTITQQLLGAEWVIGREVGENGTPHLQGYIYYKNARSFEHIKKLIPKGHIEKAKGNKRQNYDYCTKDGNYVTNMDFETTRDKLRKECLEEYKDVVWKGWQKEILDIIDGEVDNRKVYWFWEPNGNIGKSYLCKYIALTRHVIICDGKKDNVFNQVNQMIESGGRPDIIIMDIPRSAQEYVNYGVLEALKNGMLYSGKYEGGVCIFKTPHILVLANEEPRECEMSADRWVIKRITN